MACASATPAPLTRAGGGTPAGPRPQQAAAVGPCSASRWSALTPQRRLVILLRREGGDEAAPKIQAAWRAHRMRQRLLRSGRPGCWALISDDLVGKLQPHQLAGCRWLYAAAMRGGGILADDPGLGKTLQAILLFCPAGRDRSILSPAGGLLAAGLSVIGLPSLVPPTTAPPSPSPPCRTLPPSLADAAAATRRSMPTPSLADADAVTRRRRPRLTSLADAAHAVSHRRGHSPPGHPS